MSRIRIIMLSLLAVFAVGVVASASAAAAAPEFVRCARVVTAGSGKFEKSNCVGAAGTKEYIKVFAPGKAINATEECAETATAGEGTFENNECTTVGTGTKSFIKVLKGKFKFEDTEGRSYLFGNAAGTLRVSCPKDISQGVITGVKAISKVFVIFQSCVGLATSGEECPVKTPGEPEGVIKTKELSGELGLVAAAEAPSSETGLALKPTVAAFFTELEGEPATCIPLTKVVGSVIGEVEPVKVLSTTGEVIFGVKGGEGKKNKQTIQKLVGGEKDTLEAFGVTSGFESTDLIEFEEAFEVT
jgi:hypothetical protein